MRKDKKRVKKFHPYLEPKNNKVKENMLFILGLILIAIVIVILIYFILYMFKPEGSF